MGTKANETGGSRRVLVEPTSVKLNFFRFAIFHSTFE